MKFEFHPHTADIRMKVEANTLTEVFETALLGMSEIMKEGFCNRPYKGSLKVDLRITSKDRTCLLIDFLSEALSVSYNEKAVFCQLHIIKMGTNLLEASIYGATIDKFDEEIKAVTYHEANLIKNQQNKWETFIIFDI